MSWAFTVTSKDKGKLKEYSRQQLLQYHKEGTADHKLAGRVADAIDAAVDLFRTADGKLLRVQTAGHIGNGLGNFRLEVTNDEYETGNLID